MSDLYYIVDKLNSTPFNYNTNLVQISDKSSFELLQLLEDVFSKISSRYKRFDGPPEQIEVLVDTVAAFLRLVKYKPSLNGATFRQQLLSGDKEVVHQVLKWVLPQPQMLEKRAFVGSYLTFTEMPEELNYDPDILDMKEEVKRYQQDFIEAHKNVEAAKANSKDIAGLRRTIKQLEEEKERLTVKVSRSQTQVDSLADKSLYQEVCGALRSQQDEEITLSQQLQSQQQQLDRAQLDYQKALVRFRDMETSTLDLSGARLVEVLQEEVNNLRTKVNEQYPLDIESKQKRLQAVQEALRTGANSEADLQALVQQVDKLRREIQTAQERKAAVEKSRQGDKAYLQVRQAQQMSTLVARKKEEVQAKLTRLQEKKAALMAEVEQEMAKQAGQGGLSFSEEDWRAKYESMKSQLPTYKRMKKELGEIESEGAVLARTLEVLREQEANESTAVQKLEKQQGVQGFSQVATDLEKVSEEKSQLDEAKGATLQEISRTVDSINAAIKERKTKLAPHIKRLRVMRQEYLELENQYTEKKVAYDEVMAVVQRKTATLEEEVCGLKTEVLEKESLYHLLNCQMQLVDTDLRRAASAPTAERMRDRLQQKIKQAEEAARKLRDQQRTLKETHNSGLSQIEMMTDLVKLLQIKIDLVRSPMGTSSPKFMAGDTRAPRDDSSHANVFVL